MHERTASFVAPQTRPGLGGLGDAPDTQINGARCGNAYYMRDGGPTTTPTMTSFMAAQRLSTLLPSLLVTDTTHSQVAPCSLVGQMDFSPRQVRDAPLVLYTLLTACPADPHWEDILSIRHRTRGSRVPRPR